MAGAVAQPRANSMGTCPIPYPERFHVAKYFVSQLPENELPDEPRLLLYALDQQATVGPCNTPQPWGWKVVDSAKWQSWKQLGNMARLEAMRLYVRTLDEEQAEWWNRLPEGWEAAAAEAANASPAVSAAAASGGLDGEMAGAAGSNSIKDMLQKGAWVVLQQDDSRKPLPRYEQGAALLGTQVFMLGGHYGGRYLDDFWIYDLGTLQWSQAQATVAQQQPNGTADEAEPEGGEEAAAPLLSGAALPPSAGHSVTTWGERLLVLGGHTKLKDPKASIAVRLLDPTTMQWTALNTTGDTPCSRGGHTATLVGDRLYVFGGEDCNRRPLADLHILDLTTMIWASVEIPGKPKSKPPPRCGHAALVCHDKLIVFGGGSIANCYNDCWMLDLDTLQWTHPTMAGDLPAPRAGHASVLVGQRWFILGGGNNVRGCTDMLYADLSEASVGNIAWKRVASVPVGSPLSCEGISLLHCPELDALVAFGGYNGKYHNAVSVFKLPAPGEEAAAEQQAPAEQQPQQQPAEPATSPKREATAAAAADAAAAAALSGAPPPLPLPPQQQPQANGTGEKGAAGDKGEGSQHGEGLGLRELAVAREQLKRELAAAQAAAEEAQQEVALAKDSAGQEISLLRRQLAAAQAALGDAEKSVEDVRHQLSAEQARTLKLEAQVAELNEKLAQAGDLERELEKYRKINADSRKGSGLWGYISGANS